MNNKAIIFQCPEDLKILASEKLSECGISMSEFLRTCLQHFVERQSNVGIKAEIKQVAEDASNSF